MDALKELFEKYFPGVDFSQLVEFIKKVAEYIATL